MGTRPKLIPGEMYAVKVRYKAVSGVVHPDPSYGRGTGSCAMQLTYCMEFVQSDGRFCLMLKGRNVPSNCSPSDHDFAWKLINGQVTWTEGRWHVRVLRGDIISTWADYHAKQGTLLPASAA